MTRPAIAAATLLLPAAIRVNADVSSAGLSLRGPLAVRPNGTLAISGKAFPADRLDFASRFARRCVEAAFERPAARPLDIMIEYSADRMLARDMLDLVRTARGINLSHDRFTTGRNAVLECGPIRVTVVLVNGEGWLSTDNLQLLQYDIRARQRAAVRPAAGGDDDARAEYLRRLENWAEALQRLRVESAREGR